MEADLTHEINGIVKPCLHIYW